jgi:hypothetical protein
MDSERFDGLVRRFGQSRSRRQTLRGLAGAAAAGAFAVGGRGASADTCKAEGKACKKNSQCCSNTCVGGTGGSALDGTCRPAPDCHQQCEEAFIACLAPCDNSACRDACQRLASDCSNACEPE